MLAIVQPVQGIGFEMFNRVTTEKRNSSKTSSSLPQIPRESGSPENPSVSTLVIAQILIIAKSLLSTPMFSEQICAWVIQKPFQGLGFPDFFQLYIFTGKNAQVQRFMNMCHMREDISIVARRMGSGATLLA